MSEGASNAPLQDYLLTESEMRQVYGGFLEAMKEGREMQFTTDVSCGTQIAAYLHRADW